MRKKCNKKTTFHSLFLVFSILTLQACSNDTNVNHRDSVTQRWYTTAQVEQGEELFIDNCASCHGRKAQAIKSWRVVDSTGSYPAPPLNGTAHTWHHPLNMLKNTIENGTKGGMPAWKGKLDKVQIEATIAWMESHWPDPIYEAWRKRH